MFGQAGLYYQVDRTFLFPGVGTPKLLRGAAVVQPVENFVVDPEGDEFLKSWQSQGPDMVAEVNLLYPIKDPAEPGYFRGAPDYFRRTLPSVGSGFLFDAVISIGLGGCLARDESQNVTSSLDHLHGIRDVNFEGTTGRVIFKNTPSTPGSRKTSGLTFGAFNLGVFEDEDTSNAEAEGASS
jgi:hypothetical protein